MNGHHQPSSTRNPVPSVPGATSRPGPQDISHLDASLAAETEALMKARREFPGHRIWQELTPGRAVFVARSRHPGARPHTLVTADLPELLAALSDASRPGAANHPEPARENAPTRQRTLPPGEAR